MYYIKNVNVYTYFGTTLYKKTNNPVITLLTKPTGSEPVLMSEFDKCVSSSFQCCVGILETGGCSSPD